jgi:hypothetical protein
LQAKRGSFCRRYWPRGCAQAMRNVYLNRNFLEPIPDFLENHVQIQGFIVCKTNSAHQVISQFTYISPLNYVADN